MKIEDVSIEFYQTPRIEIMSLDTSDMASNNGCFTTDTSCGHGDGGCGAQPPKFPD